MNLLVTDFDGTFFDNNYKKNIQLIKKYKNIDFVIATGRNYPSLKKNLKIECNYYICNDGGYILDNNENILYRNSIKKEICEVILNRIKELKYKDYFIDNIEMFSKKIINNINKISIRIKDEKYIQDMEYIISGIDDVYAYISTNWINILSTESNKSKAIEFLLKDNKYENIYVVGNDINDIDMLKKYNGYYISNKESKDFNTITSFIELEDIIKND